MTNPDTQFKPGDPRASEAGKKSRRKPLEVRMQEFLNEKMQEGDDRSREDILRQALFKFAIKGNMLAVKEMLDRAYGKAKQSIEHTGEGGDPIQSKITIEFVESKKKCNSPQN
jgi:hypothetical protein